MLRAAQALLRPQLVTRALGLCQAPAHQPHPAARVLWDRFLHASHPARMPTVGVNRDLLFKKLGRTYSECAVGASMISSDW